VTDIEELGRRVAEASEGSREIDALIAEVVLDHHVKREPRPRSWRVAPQHSGPYINLPAYTSSVDAGRVLIARLLPGWSIASGTLGERDMPWACITEPDGDCRDFTGHAPTEALALVEALLNALSSIRPNGGAEE
jgi:hypothetical protein